MGQHGVDLAGIGSQVGLRDAAVTVGTGDVREQLFEIRDIVIDGGAVVVRSGSAEMAAQFFHLDSDQYPDFDAYLERQFATRISERGSTH